MKDFLKVSGLIILTILCFTGLLFIMSGIGLIHFKFFGPKYESVRRQVFEETKSYTYGAVQDLVKYKYEWERADYTGKKAIENVVRMRFANFDPNKINNPELRYWFESIISGK